MRRSKIEMYVDVLRVLAAKPLKLTHIMYKANMNCNVVTQVLDFMLKQGLVEKKVAGKRTVVYASTTLGASVLKSFRELNKALPIIEEENRNFGFVLRVQSELEKTKIM
jgi:predicted transcriptional regulator